MHARTPYGGEALFLMRRIIITVLVAVHLVASLWHGNLHSQLSINLSPKQTLFVLVVILVAPIAAAALVWTRYFLSGLWVFFLSMLGSLLFGVYHHYVMVSSDNINFLPGVDSSSHHQFALSAGVIALLELAAALYGAFCLGRDRRGMTKSEL